MTAVKVDLMVEQGATYEKHLAWKSAPTPENPDGSPISLAGFSARLQVRADYGAVTPILDLSSSGVSPAITLGGAAGTIDIRISATVTASLVPGDDQTGKLGYYDLVLIEDLDSTQIIRLMRGVVFVSPRVTVPA